jgi:hypothetical protein
MQAKENPQAQACQLNAPLCGESGAWLFGLVERMSPQSLKSCAKQAKTAQAIRFNLPNLPPQN